MSPENDQCRWIGIRPTNPPEDIPVTLNGEVPHVIVDSGGGGLAAGAPVIITYYLAASTVNVWYTVADILGDGHILAVRAGSNILAYFLEFRLTIDGGAPVTYTTNVNTINMYMDLNQASSFHKELPLYLVKFDTGFKYEIRQVLSSPRPLIALVTYLTV